MARKPRDYKAEYARTKARIKAAGFKSEREYKRVRKELGLPRTAAPAPRRILAASAPEKLQAASKPSATSKEISRLRRECAAWSKKHSRKKRSEYRPSLTDDQVRRYHHAYVEELPKLSRRQRNREKRARLYDYLVPDWMTDEEWKQFYERYAG